MLNARTVKQWLSSALPSASLESHFLAVSSATDKCAQFGVSPENVFPIWDWVGGRFSGTSAVGVLPLSIAFGFDVCRSFLDGARSVDRHFLEAPFSQNIPVLMGLAGLWNSSFLKMAAHAIVPYCEGLERFPAHIQQVDMEVWNFFFVFYLSKYWFLKK